jgi:hypothetical protein
MQQTLRFSNDTGDDETSSSGTRIRRGGPQGRRFYKEERVCGTPPWRRTATLRILLYPSGGKTKARIELRRNLGTVGGETSGPASPDDWTRATPAEVGLFFDRSFYTTQTEGLCPKRVQTWIDGGNDAVFAGRG